MHPNPLRLKFGLRGKVRRAGSIAAALLCLLPLPSRAVETQSSNPFLGIWFDDTGKGAVEIRDCGRRLCGHIVWLREPNDATGRPLTDAYNPEPSQRRRPICGLQVIGELQAQPDGTWDSGWIYDPKVGKSYSVALQLENRNRLIVTGYAGMKLFGQSFAWNRAPADLQRCALAKEATAPAAAEPTHYPRHP